MTRAAPVPWHAALGAALREARAARGLTQTELGARMRPPCSPSEICRWERGAAGLTIASLAAVAEALGGVEVPGPAGMVIDVRARLPRGGDR